MKFTNRKFVKWTALFLIVFAAICYSVVKAILPVPRFVLDHCGPQAWFGSSPDGKLLFTSDISDWDAHYLEATTPIHVWSSETGKLLGTIGVPPEDKKFGNIWVLACSVDGRYLAVQGQDSTIRVYSLLDFTQRVTAIEPGHTRFSFSPDGKYFDLCVGSDFRRCDLTAGPTELRWKNNPTPCTHIMGSIGFYRQPQAFFWRSPVNFYSKDASYVMVQPTDDAPQTAGGFERFFIYDIRTTPKLLRRQTDSELWSLSPDGRTFSIETAHGREPIAIEWAISSGRFLIAGIPPQAGNKNVPSMQIIQEPSHHLIREGGILRSKGNSSVLGITVWDAATTPPRVIKEFPNAGQHVLLKDGRALVLQNSDLAEGAMQLSLENLQTGSAQQIGETKGSGMHWLRATPDNQRFVIGHTCRDKSKDWSQYWTRAIDKLSKMTGKEFTRLQMKRASSPNTEIRDTETGDVLRTLKNHYPMSILPDGKTLIAQNSDYTIQLWDILPPLNWPKAIAIAFLPALLITLILQRLIRFIQRLTIRRGDPPKETAFLESSDGNV